MEAHKEDPTVLTLREIIDLAVDCNIPPDSYFDGVIFDGGNLDGTHDIWCIDTDRTITQNQGLIYKIFPFSSYDPNILDELIMITGDLDDTYENLDLVNWILNQDFVGQGFTYGEVQKAIWELVDPTRIGQFSFTLGPFDQANVDQITAAAIANGEGFVPSCGELVGIVLIPHDWDPVTQTVGAKRQILIIALPVDCETAWAFGAKPPENVSQITEFEKSWGWFFKYTIQ